MGNLKETIDSEKVFKMIMQALQCGTKVGTGYWTMWNGSSVKESFPRHYASNNSFFDKYTIRVLSSMLSTALDMNFGENFIKGETDREKKADIKKNVMDEFEIDDYHEKHRLQYLCNLASVAAALCGCSEEKYNAHQLQSVVLKTMFNYMNSAVINSQYDSCENYLEFEYTLILDYQGNISFLLYVFFMYFLRDIASGKREISVEDGSKLFGEILLTVPFYKFIIEVLPVMDESVNFNEILGVKDPKTGKKHINYKHRFVVECPDIEEDDEDDVEDEFDIDEDKDKTFFDLSIEEKEDSDEKDIDPFRKKHMYRGGYDFPDENN